eukprot:TRINITY_DN1804_c0_g2_i1.p1 TRINITY_DN1804_c0_g2~~TRINITY_DN1804_c0_g2_i1.p1  ORF type:complete len:925 (+),score=183.84 TRINITY_DN1804_c0_g2_i1:229-3003(+)
MTPAGRLNSCSSGDGVELEPSSPSPDHAATARTAMSSHLAASRESIDTVSHAVWRTPGHKVATSCSARVWTCLAKVPFGGCATLESAVFVALLVLAFFILVVSTSLTGHTFRSYVDIHQHPFKVGIIIALWGLFVVVIILALAVCIRSKVTAIDFTDYQMVSLQAAPQAPVPPMRDELVVDGGRFMRDTDGRVVIPRGVNLGGNCKLPSHPDGATWRSGGLRPGYGRRGPVTFVGRPAPLTEIDTHLARLRAWGFTFCRFLVTWEAVEHDGPGIYDQEYLDYLVQAVRRAHDHGIVVFIDPHQDCWSRWTGGDGAPGWTLELAGFSLASLHSSGATMTHQGHGDPFPKMGWFSNYCRLACATMFTLFWAGDTYAPIIRAPDGGSFQAFLQDHYCSAIAKIAEALKDEPNVVGVETMNEPSPGWAAREADLDDWGLPPVGFMSGPRLTPLEAMATGCGTSVEVDSWAEPMRYDRRIVINPHGVLAWRHGSDSCIWRRMGVWEPGAPGQPPVLLKPDFFRRKANGDKYDFMREFFAPFLDRFRRAITTVFPRGILLVESPIWLEFDGEVRPPVDVSPADVKGMVWAPHYYDGITLLTKNFRDWFTFDEKHRPVIGTRSTIIKAFARVVDSHRRHADGIGPTGVPSLIGETGVPFDMTGGSHFTDGEWSKVAHAADAVCAAVEKCLLPFTWWNYCPDNSNHRGDMWNGEDFSIWSTDQLEHPDDLHSGGRVLPAVVRPYALRIAGTPLTVDFEPFDARREWRFTFSTQDWVGNTAETVIYVPQYQYIEEAQLVVEVSDGGWALDWPRQTLVYRHTDARTEHWVLLWRDKKRGHRGSHAHRASHGEQARSRSPVSQNPIDALPALGRRGSPQPGVPQRAFPGPHLDAGGSPAAEMPPPSLSEAILSENGSCTALSPDHLSVQAPRQST